MLDFVRSNMNQSCIKDCEDPITTLVKFTTSMSTNAISILWDATIFGRDNELSLFIYKSDLMEIISGIEDLNVSILQLWMM